MHRTCNARRVIRHLLALSATPRPPLLTSKRWTWGKVVNHSNILKGGRFFCRVMDERKKSLKQEEALQATLEEISKNFGVEAVMWLGRHKRNEYIPVIPTGSLSLDIALGIGGLPKGRIVEIYGPEASGKTTLALHVIAEAQKSGGNCAFIDADNTLDSVLGKMTGVHNRRLVIARPTSGEEALNQVDRFIRSGTIDVLVVDNVGALISRAETTEDIRIRLHARLMSQTLRKLTHKVSTSKTLLIFITQTRPKLHASGNEGPAEASTGGNALKCYSSVRLNVISSGQIWKDKESIGYSTLVRVVKNKLAPPFKTAQFEIEFGKGISREGEVLDQAVKYGVITKIGSFHSYEGGAIGDCREDAKAHIREHTELREALMMQIRERVGKDGEGQSFPDEPIM